MESELNSIRKKQHHITGEIGTKDLELLSKSDFFKYLPDKTKRKINQVLTSSKHGTE